MKAKNATPKDRELLYEAYKYSQLGGIRAIGDKLSEAKQERFFNLGLLKIERSYEGWDGNMYPIYGLSASGLAAIQPLIDKAAADKLALEAEKQTGEERRVNMIAALNGKFFAAGVDLGLIDTIAYSDSPREIMVRFAITMAVRYDHIRNQYEPQIYSASSGRTPLDIDALIREAQDARAVAEILNGMLEGEQS